MLQMVAVVLGVHSVVSSIRSAVRSYSIRPDASYSLLSRTRRQRRFLSQHRRAACRFRLHIRRHE